MIDHFIQSIMPFAVGLVIIAGANLAGWVQFSNTHLVGFVLMICGVLMLIHYMVVRLTTK